MTDTVNKEKRSKIMASVKSKNTGPEKKLRKLLHSIGYRYRLHVSDLPGKPDLVFPKYNAVIEVNGCFWHLHGCDNYNLPSSNEDYWLPKLKRNRERDQENIDKLKNQGWRVLTVWECAFDNLSKILEEADTFLKSQTPEKEIP